MLQPMNNEFAMTFDAMAKTEEHRKTCTAVPCERCDRKRCGGCGGSYVPTLPPWEEPGENPRRPVTFHQEACLACTDSARAERALTLVYASVPRRFKWAIRATAEELRQVDSKTGRERVQLTTPFIHGALERAAGGCRMVYGDTATGKTSFIVAVACAMARRDWKAYSGMRYASAYWLAGARSRHALGQGEAPEVIEAMNASLLILDDLGNDLPEHRNPIGDILFRRHDEDLPTWVTTGYPVDHLSTRYGPAQIRRIIEEPNSLIEMGKR